ncbi:MAG: trimethylamine methyltransferase family protein [Hadesarchaea archaeon]|nr:trimethylamine methyltransferase family protein [Hadesarchaea archaeon]
MTRKLIEPFTKDELSGIHQASLEIMERAGVWYEREMALKILEKAGAEVDYKTKIAKLPEYLVKDALQKIPGKFRLAGRERKHDFVVGDDKSYWGMMGGPLIVDLETGKVRETTKKDVAEWARFADVLDDVWFITPPMARDVNPMVSAEHEFEAMVNNSSKFLEQNLYSGTGARNVFEMASVVQGGEEELIKNPLIFGAGCAVSPLQHCAIALDVWFELASKGLPCLVATEAIIGATGPVTMAGSLAVANADVLSGITLLELIKPGIPVAYSIGLSHVMDMKKAEALCGCPERVFAIAANAQLGRFYGIPTWVGVATDSKLPDAQAGYEMALSALYTTMTGNHMVMGIGSSLASRGISYEEALIDWEIMRMVSRIAQGIEVNEETLSVDLICKTGPGGSFIATEHTLKHYKKEIQDAVITDRSSVWIWEKEGKKDMAQRAREMAQNILREHQPTPLPKDVQTKLSEIVKRAEKDALKMSS